MIGLTTGCGMMIKKQPLHKAETSLPPPPSKPPSPSKQGLKEKDGKAKEGAVPPEIPHGPPPTPLQPSPLPFGEPHRDGLGDLDHPLLDKLGATITEPPALKVGVILGPGGVRSFAHVGVIRALLKSRIPIDFIVGMEWGALVGGMFANKGQVHDAEWKLYKLEKKDLLKKRSLFSSKMNPIRVDQLRDFINTHFQGVHIEKMKIKFACPALSVKSGVIQWQKQGLLIRAIRRCWPYPPIFQPKGAWVAATFSLPEAVQYLKKQGMELIIFVNVMDRGNLFTSEQHDQDYKSAILWQEVRRSLEDLKDSNDLGIEVISVKTRGFTLYDFESRRALVKAGRHAGKKASRKLMNKYGF